MMQRISDKIKKHVFSVYYLMLKTSGDTQQWRIIVIMIIEYL